ncbi:thioredoxin [Romboutsia weinsteinii]|uniref:Thioredoxin n=1 Tax=Romboutsia weinsteinii TaxID=2020949 RepID=A0A371J3C8_9FIRM|nr:thioredoxin [Romboutsia weinsteinii]RDY27213.1 thioredoxin [Romboutsia weinsteinii]
MAQIIGSNEFKSEISDGVVIVDFFATWCGPCKMLAPVFEDLSSEMEGQSKFFKVDIDQSLDLAREYQVTTVPTMIIFKDGEKVDSLVGFIPKENIKSSIEKYL